MSHVPPVSEQSPATRSSEVAAGVLETLLPKRGRLDDSIHLETPQGRSCGELIGGRSLFICDTLQVPRSTNSVLLLHLIARCHA